MKKRTLHPLLGSALLLLGLALATPAQAAPTITKHPQGLSRSLSDVASFSVNATGDRFPLGYQWLLNSAPVSGATNKTLTLTNLTAVAGSYTVVVSDDSGSVTSKQAFLVVDTIFSVVTGSPVAKNTSYTGASWGDYDNDGFIDLVTAGGTRMWLYHNEGGTHLAPVAITNVLAGEPHMGGSVRAAYWADYDNDGNLDLFVPAGGSFPDTDQLFQGLGGGAFKRVRTQLPFSQTVSASWADFNRDGFLDLFLPNAIYLGQAGGGFTRWLPEGLKNAESKTFHVVGDFNGDGFPDFAFAAFSTNSTGSYVLQLNQGGAGFSRSTVQEFSIPAVVPGAISAADFNHDGSLDLFATSSGVPGRDGANPLLRNDGTGAFESMGIAAGNSDTSSWGDYDNDGHLDLFANDGLWHNQGDGTFARVEAGSLASSTVGAYASASWGDYDNDGFLDLVVADGQIKDRLFHNNGNGNGWLLLKLVGTKSNRSAFGAKVRLKANLHGKSVLQYREIGTGNSFGQNDLRAHFGLADATQAESIEIEWPSGYRQTLRNVAGKQILTITEPSDQSRLTFGADNTLQLVGAPQAAYRIESSQDLQTWSDRPDLAVKTDDAGRASISISNGISGSVSSKEFFRVRVP